MTVAVLLDFLLYAGSLYSGWQGFWLWLIAPLAVTFLWCFRAEMKYLRHEDTYRLSPDEATPEDLARYKRLEEIRMRAHGQAMLHVTMVNAGLFMLARLANWIF